MKSIQDKLETINFDHRLWLKELAYVSMEIPLYEKRLIELFQSCSNQEEKKTLGSIIHDFAQHKEKVKEIQGLIQNHVIYVSHQAHANGQVESLFNVGHRETRQEMELFRKNYSKVKGKFHQFVDMKH